jgi:hypothetical protein
MAKQKNSVVTHGLSGMIGKMLVFRQLNGRTVISAAPRVNAQATDRQKEQRQRFQRAVLYAGAAASDPQMAAAYAAAAKPGQHIRNVAIADFLHAPDINTVDVSRYHGQPGDIMRIEVTDDFAVKEVKVVITNPDGSLVEEGYAQPEAAGYEWTYRATAVNDELEGDRIEIFASDIPGNISTETVTC